jgi:hypothetical protein
MELGTYVDGRPLTYDQEAGTFAVADAPVNADQVRGYCAAGQIAWVSSGYHDWFNNNFPAAPAPPPPPARTDHTASRAVTPSPVASAQAGTAERVQAIIPYATIWSGFIGMHPRHYTLILTDRRVVFARNTVAGRKQRVADARDGAKSEGEGFLYQLAAQADALLGLDQERYLATPPDQALAERADNFAVERAAITKTSLKTKRYYGGDDDPRPTTWDLLVIRTHGKKYEINLGLGRRQAKQALGAAGMMWTLRGLLSGSRGAPRRR